jgi:hypothetical protein
MSDLLTDRAYPLPGDERIPDARKQITRTLTIAATPETIWPLLVRMALLERHKGGVVLHVRAPRVLLLGALYDAWERRYLPFDLPRPAKYWQATWALVLTPIDAVRTRLDVRSRVAFGEDALRWASVWTHPFGDFMDHALLRRLERAAEGEHASTRGLRPAGSSGT